MMTKTRRMATILTILVLGIGSVFAAPASAGTASSTTAQATCTGSSSCWFTWGRITAGDCTMDGAKWTLFPNGSASFEARLVSSDSNDAWLMWVNLLDSAGVVLGPIHHGGDPKFVKGTVKNQWHWWFDAGSFDARFYDRINSMRMTSHC